MCQTLLKLSWEVDERKPLRAGVASDTPTKACHQCQHQHIPVECQEPAKRIQGRGLHSSTFRLKLSAFYGIGGALGAV